jgi:hypothetical protein
VAAPKILPPKILPRPGRRGCARNPADRKFTLSSRFAFHWVLVQYAYCASVYRVENGAVYFGNSPEFSSTCKSNREKSGSGEKLIKCLQGWTRSKQVQRRGYQLRASTSCSSGAD